MEVWQQMDTQLGVKVRSVSYAIPGGREFLDEN